MARRRMVHPAGFRASTKGHSVLKKWAYGKPYTKEIEDTYTPYVPTFIPMHSLYDTGREEREIHRGVDREIIFSDHMIDEAYDTARKSHNKDAALLRDATHAVPPSKRNKFRRYEEDDNTNILPFHRGKSTYVPYQKRSKKTSAVPQTDASDGISTRHLKATVPKRQTSVVPLGTMTSRQWSSSKPPRKSYQELTKRYPPDQYDKLIRSIPTFTKSMGNIDETPEASLTGSPYGSPYGTPRESPERDLGYSSQSSQPPATVRKSKGIKSRYNVGSYYRKLLQRRARDPSRQSKYWPYYDAESIGNSDVAGVISDEEYEDAYDNYPDSTDSYPRDTYYDTYPRDTYYDTYPRDEYNNTYPRNDDSSYYAYDDTRSQTPDEYIPFVPARRNFDEDEYKSTLPDLPDLAVAPYMPAYKNGGSGISEDMAFHNVVAQTAAKARKALRNINLNEYDNASLVLSVEGEYTHPERGDVLGFHYVARPIPLKGPNLATGPAYTAVGLSDESTFGKYLNTMRDFRESIRNRLESGYAALRGATRYRSTPSYSHYKPIEPPSSSSFTYSSPMIASYRKELEDGFGGSISLYPLPSRGNPDVALPSAASEAVPDHTHAVELFDSKPGVPLSTLDKIKIKVNSETYSDPRAVVASKRAARGAAYYHLPPKHVEYVYVPPAPAPLQQQPIQEMQAIKAIAHPHFVPRTNYPSHRLEKEVVVLANRYRLRPASSSSYYARVFLTKAAMAGRVSLADAHHPPPLTRRALDVEMEKRERMIHAYGRSMAWYRPYSSLYPWSQSYRYRYPYFKLSPTTTARVRVLASPLPQKRKKSSRQIKAALVGSKVDVVLPTKHRRRPKSQYAQGVVREILKQEIGKVDDDDEFGAVSKKSRPYPAKYSKSVSFRKYPYVPDMTPDVKELAGRLKSLLKKCQNMDPKKESTPPLPTLKEIKLPSRSKILDINDVRTQSKILDVKDVKTQSISSEGDASSADTSALKAHPRVPPVGRRGGKAIRDEEGQFTKPKNLLSWKYRLEARTSPGDYFHTPRTFATMRDQIREVRDKMDRHKQLMDRYLDTDTVKEAERRSLENTGSSTSKSSAEGGYNTTPVRPTSARMPMGTSLKPEEFQSPMSDVRRRVRRVICKNREDPKWFK